MAKSNITYRCGHQDTIQIYGPYAGRDRIAEREAEKLCQDCYRADVEQRHAAESAAAAEAAQAAGLPDLIGSPKQIAWAESIRAKQADNLRALDDVLANGKGPSDVASVCREIIAATLARTSAHDWVEGRNITHDRRWLSAQYSAKYSARVAQ